MTECSSTEPSMTHSSVSPTSPQPPRGSTAIQAAANSGHASAKAASLKIHGLAPRVPQPCGPKREMRLPAACCWASPSADVPLPPKDELCCHRPPKLGGRSAAAESERRTWSPPFLGVEEGDELEEEDEEGVGGCSAFDLPPSPAPNRCPPASAAGRQLRPALGARLLVQPGPPAAAAVSALAPRWPAPSPQMACRSGAAVEANTQLAL